LAYNIVITTIIQNIVVPKKRKKTSKIKGWTIHAQASFSMENDTNTYIERAAFRIFESSKFKVSNSDILADSMVTWIKNVSSENSYIEDRNVRIEKWIPIRT
jgi:hypothetical protein